MQPYSSQLLWTVELTPANDVLWRSQCTGTEELKAPEVEKGILLYRNHIDCAKDAAPTSGTAGSSDGHRVTEVSKTDGS